MAPSPSHRAIASPTSARVSDAGNEEANALQALGHACEKSDLTVTTTSGAEHRSERSEDRGEGVLVGTRILAHGAEQGEPLAASRADQAENRLGSDEASFGISTPNQTCFTVG